MNLFFDCLAASGQGAAHVKPAVALNQLVDPSGWLMREGCAPVFDDRYGIDAGKRPAHSRCGVVGEYFRMARLAKPGRDVAFLQILRQGGQAENASKKQASEHRWGDGYHNVSLKWAVFEGKR